MNGSWRSGMRGPSGTTIRVPASRPARSGIVRLWDAATGQLLLTLEGHTGWVHSVDFSPDGKRIVSGSSDRTIKLWDARTGQETLTLALRGLTPSVYCVRFSADGRRIVSGCLDATIKVWGGI